MLAYILALAVALGSLSIYLAAFFFPEVHRKNDFIWSGVGLFYALVLWVCAGRITGGLLLGQTAGVALLGWSVTQTLQLRRQITPVQQQTELPSQAEVKSTVQAKISQLSLPQRLSQLGKQVSGSANTAKNRLQENLGNLAQRQTQTEQSTGSTTTNQTSASAVETTNPNVQVIDHRTSVPKQPQSAPTEVKASPLGAEPTVPSHQPSGPDMPGESGKEPISVEAIAPEVELAPPAEPIGSGDAQDRQNLRSATPSQSEPTLENDNPELIRPNPPDPELVEAAIEDAQEKHQPASPPESHEESK